MTAETLTIDRVDRRLIHALLLDGRASFRTLAEAVGSSEQTVARRYRRMREAGVIRVVVVPDPRRYPESLFLRIRIQPGAAVAVARAMAARPDTSWVTVSSGGSEVTCAMRTASSEDRDALLLQGLPRASQVTDVATATLLHVFDDDEAAEWHALPDGLTPEDRRLLGGGTSRNGAASRRRDGRTGVATVAPVGPEDDDLLAALFRDGRASWAAVAARTGRSEAQVARRVDALLAAGAVFVDTELAPKPLGFRAWAMLWISAAPAALERVGRELSLHPETAFVAATTGATNLVASVLCRDTDDLYRYMTRRVGPIEGVRDLEVVPAMRVVKQQGSLMDGDRLPDPLAADAA
ncbi:Lrp/AsnC family transcriptional regulator [Patulibacter sp.]|uniref:Lrp/AsnC family transcriptional regulator n=1 Tax=Patulibacter sp. TaxID=1912859 RepID=UPI00271BC8AC|nr:Lrp/AsnC family transcriptional regulator [Patulibacter sp.]MDO9408112.1 Lrp/AsnC family transcriptional regulator [Patulibacter sp.]